MTNIRVQWRRERSCRIWLKTANINIDKDLECGVYNGISQYGKTTIMSDGSNMYNVYS